MSSSSLTTGPRVDRWRCCCKADSENAMQVHPGPRRVLGFRGSALFRWAQRQARAGWPGPAAYSVLEPH